MAKLNRRNYAFTAIVGQEEMKLALLLNVVDPLIGGVLIMGHRGTGKSTAVRALADLLPEIDVVAGCPYNCDPKEELCDQCRGSEITSKKMPGLGGACRRMPSHLPLKLCAPQVETAISM